MAIEKSDSRLTAKGEHSIDVRVDLTQSQCYYCGGKGTVDTKSTSPGPLCPICEGKGVVDDR